MNKPIKNVWAVLPRKAGNGIYKLESCKKLKEKKLEKDMAEMFGHSFDQQMIRDVLISHDYDAHKSLESFLQIADDSSQNNSNKQENPFEKIAENLIMSNNKNEMSNQNKKLNSKNNITINDNTSSSISKNNLNIKTNINLDNISNTNDTNNIENNIENRINMIIINDDCGNNDDEEGSGEKDEENMDITDGYEGQKEIHNIHEKDKTLLNHLNEDLELNILKKQEKLVTNEDASDGEDKEKLYFKPNNSNSSDLKELKDYLENDVNCEVECIENEDNNNDDDDDDNDSEDGKDDSDDDDIELFENNEIQILGGSEDDNEYDNYDNKIFTFGGKALSNVCVGTEVRDWLVVDQLVRGIKTSYKAFKVVTPNILKIEVKEDEKFEEKIDKIKPENYKQIVKNNVKQFHFHFEDLQISSHKMPICLRLDASAQTEDEDDVMGCDEKLSQLSNCFPQVDRRHLKYLYESCYRSCSNTADILAEFGFDYNEEKPLNGWTELDEGDKVKENIGIKEINEVSEETEQIKIKEKTIVSNISTNSRQPHKHLYVINSGSKKPILDSINRRVFNPNTKYRHSKRLSEFKSGHKSFKDSKKAKDMEINIDPAMANDLWMLFASKESEKPSLSTNLTLKIDQDTARSLFESLKKALANNEEATETCEPEAVDQSSLLSTQIKYKQLEATFPKVNKQILANIFQASGYSQKVCAGTIRESSLDQPAKESMTQQFSDQLELRLIQQAIDASLQQNEQQQNSTTTAASHDSLKEGVVTRDVNLLYDSLLDKLHTTRMMFVNRREQAKQAISNKQYSVAGFYTEEAKLLEHKIKEEQQLAAEIIFQKKFNLGQGIVDLHGFTCDQVLHILPAIIKQQQQYIHKSRRSKGHLTIVTGSGINSPGGVAKIKPLVNNYLRKNNYAFQQMTQGVLKVNLNSFNL